MTDDASPSRRRFLPAGSALVTITGQVVAALRSVGLRLVAVDDLLGSA